MKDISHFKRFRVGDRIRPRHHNGLFKILHVRDMGRDFVRDRWRYYVKGGFGVYHSNVIKAVRPSVERP